MKRRQIAKELFASAAVTAVSPVLAQPNTGPTFAATRAENGARIPIVMPQFPPGDVRRYGALENTADSPALDNSKIIQQLFDMTRGEGGVISFPSGDWSFYLDISLKSDAAILPIIIEGNGAVFRCASIPTAHSCVVYGDNTRGQQQFTASNIQFRDCNFLGRRHRDKSRANLDYAVEFHGTAAIFHNCTFQNAAIAGFYAMYGQYNEFWSCMFGACTATASSTGCVLDSHSASASSNEVLFNRCKFFTCSNFLLLRGCFHTRIRDTTFQGGISGGQGGIILDADSTGQGSFGTIIDGCWFEINQFPHIVGRICQGTRLHENSFFASGGLNQLDFGYCYDLEVTDNVTYAAISCKIMHSGSDTLTAALKWHGNNFNPMISLDHAGPSFIDVQSAATRTRRNDNMLLTTGQEGTGGVPLIQSDQYGFRPTVARGATTALFRINLERFEPAPHAPLLVLEIQIFAWEDSPNASDYGRSAHVQSFTAFISLNAGQLTAYLASLSDGTDLGTDTAARAIGKLTLTAASEAAPGGGSVAFSASFAGAGTEASSARSATMGYRMTAMGGNPFTISRL